MTGTESQPATLSIRDAGGCGSHLPICDDAAFEQVTAMLPPNAILTYLRTLSARGTTLLGELREQQGATGGQVDTVGKTIEFSRPEILIRQAHNLAGGAGILGWRRLAFVASRFEQAVEQASADAPDLGASLAALIDECLAEMQRRIAAL